MTSDAATGNTQNDLERGLSAIASRIMPGGQGAAGVRRLSGGATQEIFRFELATADGPVPLILRRAPGGLRVSDTAVGLETEAKLIAAAGAVGAPVPAVPYVLGEDDGLGHGFIMGFVEGETLGGRIVKSPDLAAARPGLARACGEILARVHTIDPAAFPTLKRQTPRELVEQWRGAYRASAWPRPVFELAFRWLDQNCPAATRMRLVHGDFRNGNLMIGPDGVRAVLDWELAHLGDPMEDLGWVCVNSWRFGEIDKPVGGFGTREELFAGYEAAGRRVDPISVKFWEVMGTLRWGVMCCGMMQRFRISPEHSVERAMIGRRASETEIDLLRLLAPRGS